MSLKELRQRANLSKEKLGVAIDSCGATIGHWERDPGRITISGVFRLATVLEMTPEKVFEAITSSLGRTA